jgi:hypothetical protein
MSAHLSDRALLAELIRLGETILSHPFGLVPGNAFDLNSIAGDLVAAMRCPAYASRVGAAEGILFTSLQTITTGGAASQAELARYAFMAQQALAIARDHYFALVRSDAVRRAAGEVRP